MTDRFLRDHMHFIFLALLLVALMVVGKAAPPVEAAIPAFDGGRDHTVALREDGTVWTWGRAEDGRLGTGVNIGVNGASFRSVSRRT